jgi:hypothetical protein
MHSNATLKASFFMTTVQKFDVLKTGRAKKPFLIFHGVI